jgi:hypothetical protein
MKRRAGIGRRSKAAALEGYSFKIVAFLREKEKASIFACFCASPLKAMEEWCYNSTHS